LNENINVLNDFFYVSEFFRLFWLTCLCMICLREFSE
jgi:hypothetical protein